MAYEHLALPRIEQSNLRRSGSAARPPGRLPEPRAHAGTLLKALEDATQAATAATDGRLLLTIDVVGKPLDDLGRTFRGMEVVSEEATPEGRRIAVVFVDQQARDDFEGRLAMMQRGEKATSQDLLLAIRGIDGWGPDDRTSPSLKRVLAEEWTDERAQHVVDVELFSLGAPTARRQLLATFEEQAQTAGLQVLDRVQQAVLLVRIRAQLVGIRWLLGVTEVRSVELPPRFQLSPSLRRLAANDLSVSPAPSDAPLIAVLDSGVIANHPLLQGAVVHAESLREGEPEHDENGHGTAVAAIAAYGDLESAAEALTFVPTARLMSGRVLDGDARYQELIENQVRRAVVAYAEAGCRIFNLSLADEEHPYDGLRLRSFAVTLDALAREYDVLFVLAAGNLRADRSRDWRASYPDYLREPEARLLDPAPALNAITVGSIARHELDHAARTHPTDPDHQPIARRGEPSPFTRCGPGFKDAIKPELVEHGGNWSIQTRVERAMPGGDAQLGVLTASHDLANGIMSVQCGTSMAAPKVANAAARVLAAYPQASTNLLRALLVAHADHPQASIDRIPHTGTRRHTIGYGVTDVERAVRSLDHAVTLVHDDSLDENTTHFYEVPLPEDFFGGGARRAQRVRVAIAHAPLTRQTRLDYRGSRLKMRVVGSSDLDRVVRPSIRRSERDELGAPRVGIRPALFGRLGEEASIGGRQHHHHAARSAVGAADRRRQLDVSPTLAPIVARDPGDIAARPRHTAEDLHAVEALLLGQEGPVVVGFGLHHSPTRARAQRVIVGHEKAPYAIARGDVEARCAGPSIDSARFSASAQADNERANSISSARRWPGLGEHRRYPFVARARRRTPRFCAGPASRYHARMRVLGFAVLALALAYLPGCYLSHERGAVADVGVIDAATRDAGLIDAPTIDAGPTCTFGFRTADGVTGMCAISAGSTESCAEAAICVCAARTGGTPTEVLACAGWDLTPRGAITFADFCTTSPPARAGLTEALEGFLGPESLLEPSPGCAVLPALVGVRPFDLCGAIATELCRCVPDCDLDAALGRACLDLSTDQADCIVREVFMTSPECSSVSNLRAIADRCGA